MQLIVAAPPIQSVPAGSTLNVQSKAWLRRLGQDMQGGWEKAEPWVKIHGGVLFLNVG